MAPFSEELPTKSYSEAVNRPSTDYVRFTPEYRVVLRMLNDHPKTVWKHFIPQANQGRGLSANCPNTRADMNVCPFELSVKGLPKDSEERKEKIARRRFIINVLDRTPYTVCSTCGTNSPQTKNKTCVNRDCGADLSKADFAPLNKVKIMEQGPRLFNEGLNPIAENQAADFDGAAITDYDIVFTTQGTGRDKKISALPKPPAPLDLNGLELELYRLDDLAEPSTLEEIELMVAGAPIAEILALREGAAA